MPPHENPALNGFAALIEDELVWAQVVIFRRERGFELRHVADRLSENEKLSWKALAEVRELAQFTAAGAFRPLKAAPNLRTGWRLSVASEAELELALQQLYPNAIADWFALQSGNPPITNYREFTARQTGMYRIATQLTDVQAAQMIRACCHPQFCGKRRFWTVAGLATDAATEKSLLPCLEPCALLLEFARKSARQEQFAKMKTELSPDDMASLQVALKIALAHPSPEVREADFAAPANPRRFQLVLEKLPALAAGAVEKE